MKMKTGNSNILKFIINFKSKNGALWLNSETLKASVPPELANSTTKTFITENKNKIQELLLLNNVFSELDFKAKEIYILPKEDCYNLSFAQERLLFIDRYEQGTSAYNIPILLKLKPQIKITSFINAIETLIEQNEILRTVYIERDGDFYQKELKQKITINKHSSETETDFNTSLSGYFDHIFNLSNEPPIKIDLIEFNNFTYCSIVVHHIAFDGWSSEVFLNQVEISYNQIINSTLHDIHTETNQQQLQYKDYSEWQRAYLSGKTYTNQIDYWKNYLSDFENLELPIDKERPAKLKYDGDNCFLSLDKTTSARLVSIARQTNTTLYNVLLSAYFIFLNKYTNQEDLIVGTTIANRHFEETRNLIGYLVNSLPIRIKLDNENNIKEVIQQISKNLTAVHNQQDLPFEKIVEELKLEKDTSRNPIFQTLFSIVEFDSKTEYNLFNSIDIFEIFKISKFDLTLNIDISEEEFKINFNYATSLFEKDTVHNMVKHFSNILKLFTVNLNKKVKDISILSPEEYQQIVFDWNKTKVPYPENKTIHQLFEEQAEKNPNNIAVIFEDKKITYKELNSKANQLAHTIRLEYKKHWDIEVKPDTMIGIYIERSLEMTISILAILKAGAAYVPFDKADPEERLKFKINDCECKMILTSSNMVQGLVFLTESDTLPVSVDTYWHEIEKHPSSNPNNINKPNDLAYVIYTSGSTGNPKGSLIEHTSLVNRLIWMKDQYNFNEADNILQKTPYSFDVSVWELILPYLCGATLVFAKPDGHKNPEYLTKLIEEEEITKLHFVPSMLSAFVDYLDSSNNYNLDSITDIICSGEALFTDLTSHTQKLLPNTKIHNLYGPTEATIDVSYHEYNKATDNDKSIPIGKPIQNYMLYILDKYFNPVPVGVHGELYISGVGLARGYFNRDDLTNEKFVENPFIPQQKMYKTGDICKHLKDGSIEYIRRNDNQIKLNGLRIELGEIEAKIAEYKHINNCAVIVHQQSASANKTLIVYYSYTSNFNECSINNKNFENNLKTYLRSKLPEYMVPQIYIGLDKLPLNTSGKINRKALPKPDLSQTDNEYIPPKTELEEKLVKIWQELLGIDRIGITDNFFTLGGNSITAIKLMHCIKNNTDLSIELSDIFQYLNIQNICKNCLKSNTEILDEGEI